jgi:hypothetical protein
VGLISIEPQFDEAVESVGWLAEIHQDGICAMAELSSIRIPSTIIVHEQHLHPSLALAQFIKDNQLTPSEN